MFATTSAYHQDLLFGNMVPEIGRFTPLLSALLLRNLSLAGISSSVGLSRHFGNVPSSFTGKLQAIILTPSLELGQKVLSLHFGTVPMTSDFTEMSCAMDLLRRSNLPNYVLGSKL